MEKIPEIKKESGVNRIIGTEEQTEKDLLAFFKEKFELGFKEETDKAHSAELDNLIPKLNNYLKEFCEQYGVDSINIPSENIHILDRGKLTPEQIEILKKRAENIGGFYSPGKQAVGMLIEYEDGKKLSFLQMLIHEMLHLNSFGSLHKLPVDKAEQGQQLTRKVDNGKKEEISLGIRRAGFSIKTIDGKTYFYDTNEAVITELEMRFDWKYFPQFPELEQDLKRKQKILEEISQSENMGMDYLKRTFAHIGEEHEGRVELKKNLYDEERAALNKLIDEIYEKDKSDFSSREDVFNVFAKATMTGRLLPIARLIEKTYGRGSFRALGEKFGKQLEK